MLSIDTETVEREASDDIRSEPDQSAMPAMIERSTHTDEPISIWVHLSSACHLTLLRPILLIQWKACLAI